MKTTLHVYLLLIQNKVSLVSKGNLDGGRCGLHSPSLPKALRAWAVLPSEGGAALGTLTWHQLIAHPLQTGAEPRMFPRLIFLNSAAGVGRVSSSSGFK